MSLMLAVIGLFAMQAAPAAPPAQAHGPRVRNRAYLVQPEDMLSQGRVWLEGSVTVRLAVDAEGHVSGCTIAKSSGSDRLDKYTCWLIAQRARVGAATDASGMPVAGSIDLPIGWKAIEGTEPTESNEHGDYNMNH